MLQSFSPPRPRAHFARQNRRAVSHKALKWFQSLLASFDSSDQRSPLEIEADGPSASEILSVPPDMENGIMLQGFGWDSCEKGGWYSVLMDKIDDMSKLGVTFVWLPPPSQSVSKEGYLPSQLYAVDTPYGSKVELQVLLQRLAKAGIYSLADIVINHRCADKQDSSGAWNIFTDEVEHPGKSIAWGKWAIVGGDGYGGTGELDSGADFGPAPDLDHTNQEVRESLRDWLNWLNKEIGYHGWRLDYVKGYAPKWVKYYIEETVGHQAMSVGEYWSDMDWGNGHLAFKQDHARQELCDYIDACDGKLKMFDFPTKGILQEAVKQTEYHRLRDEQGKPPGLVGWWPSRACTFVDNHDTGSTQQHWPFPKTKVMTGYAYIMTHPGMPCLQWDHVFEDGHLEAITRLAHIRRRNGIHMRSAVSITCADRDMYVASIDEKVVVKLGPKLDMGQHLPKEDQGWKLAASGMEFAIWDKHGQDED